MPRARGFWREPVAWVVVGLPAACVVALVATLALATRDPVDATANRTQRIAQIQLEDLAADSEAARLGLRAQVHADPARGTVEVELRVTSGEAAPGTLMLAMRHPVREDLDRLVTLTHEDGRWHGRTDAWLPKQRWNLQLVPEPPTWRLTGRLDAGEMDTELAAAVAR